MEDYDLSTLSGVLAAEAYHEKIAADFIESAASQIGTKPGHIRTVWTTAMFMTVDACARAVLVDALRGGPGADRLVAHVLLLAESTAEQIKVAGGDDFWPGAERKWEKVAALCRSRLETGAPREGDIQ